LTEKQSGTKSQEILTGTL